MPFLFVLVDRFRHDLSCIAEDSECFLGLLVRHNRSNCRTDYERLNPKCNRV
jgi:hypothetical protein